MAAKASKEKINMYHTRDVKFPSGNNQIKREIRTKEIHVDVRRIACLNNHARTKLAVLV